ncbi:unnamed protein product [Adineta steineri]|uniref:G-protein coupled receptors family 1 profile domain-containing protein n=1 Tax=Adineta steineri TaxID=433720 RepID=A0A816B3Z7_9BILA|nr:unnamed protein product [Adineta steineri]CAF1603446.1 unnamed protein product [Adineta steineri]
MIGSTSGIIIAEGSAYGVLPNQLYSSYNNKLDPSGALMFADTDNNDIQKFSVSCAGVIGNGMNILVMLSVSTYRKTPCTFYFLITSISNILFITIILISRLVITGLNVDLTRTSVIWCKSRLYLIGVFSLMSFTFSCLATIDQFFATSRSASLRRCSNIKWTYRIVFITILACFFHASPCLIFLDISPITNTCINMSSAYTIYLSFYSLGLTCFFPIVIMVVFGYLTYRNIQSTRVLVRQYADRQLARMTLIQVALVVICMLPYGIDTTYNLITNGMVKDINRIIEESFALTVFTLLTYFYYVGSCFMFLVTSSRFRRATKDRILFWRRANQVLPIQNPTFQAPTLGNTTHN